MATELWQRVFVIFEQAIDLPSEERQAFLDRACAGDRILRRGAEELLAAHGATATFLEPAHPAAGDLVGSDPRDRRSLARGTAVGSYRILRRIGQGGMGTVYLAVRDDDAFERRVVIKLIRPGVESEAILRRFRTERQILASLDHPFIARLYDGGTTADDLPYLVLEYVEGVPLDAYCEHNRLSVDERLALFRKVCAAVHYAHQNLVVHRDLKPSNILVNADGEPKLLDFGIAKLLKPELAAGGDLEPTTVWHQPLTPNYASPEQIRGQRITTASDVYSLGVLLYRLLTGRRPRSFAGRSTHEIESLLDDSEPLPPSVAITPADDERGAQPTADAEPRNHELRRQLVGDLDAIVLKALRRAPRQRYGSVERLDADLERYQRGLPVDARAGTWIYRAGRFVRRNRHAVATAAAVSLLVIGFGVATAIQASRIAFEHDQARAERDKKAQLLELVLELFRSSRPFVVPGQELTVREALERSVPVLDAGLHRQPAVPAELLHTSGSIRGELGELYRAEAEARRAVEIARRLEAEESPDLAGPMLGEPLDQLVSALCYRNEHEASAGPALEALAASTSSAAVAPATSDASKGRWIPDR